MKICPDCGYFNEEKYDEYSPYPGECEDCYRYEICLDAARKENKMINANDLYYDDNEAIKFIKKETGLDESVIEKVLGSEFRYMQSIGIIEEGIDYD